MSGEGGGSSPKKPTGANGESTGVQSQSQSTTNDPSAPPSNGEEFDNSDTKISRQYLMSLLIMCYIALSSFYSNVSIVRSYDYTINYSDTFDDRSEDSKDYWYHLQSFRVMYMLAYLCLFLATLNTIYFYPKYGTLANFSNPGDASAGGGGANTRIWAFVIAGLYAIGIILLIAGFITYMAWAYDNSDYSPYPEDFYSDNELFGRKTYNWATFFPIPCIYIILAAQFILTDLLLNTFNFRIFLYSVVLTITFFIYSLYYVFRSHYKYSLGDFYISVQASTTEECAYTFTSFAVVIVLIASGLMAAFSGMQIGGKGAAINNSDKIYVGLTILLVITLFIYSLCQAFANSFSGMLLWVCTIMITSDVLF